MDRQNQQTHVPITLPCLIELDQDTSLFTGHCLTFDLVSTAKTPHDAAQNLRTLIKRHIEYSYTHHKAGLSVSADECEWERWRSLVNSDKITKMSVEPIEVNLNEPWDSPTFWANESYATGADLPNAAETDQLCTPR